MKEPPSPAREALEAAQAATARATGQLALAIASGRLRRPQLEEVREEMRAALATLDRLFPPQQPPESRESSS